MAHAIGRGLRRFDFTIGDERYKSEWCDQHLRLYDYSAAATWRGWPASALSAARRRLKRYHQADAGGVARGVAIALRSTARCWARAAPVSSLLYFSIRSRFSVIRAMTRRNAARSRAAMPCSASSVMRRATPSNSLRSRFGLRGQEDPHLAAVVVAANAADQPGPLHAAQRDHGGRFHHADPRRQFALRQPVRDPQHAQEIPLAARHAVGRDAPFEQPLKGAMRIAHQIAGTGFRRKSGRAARVAALFRGERRGIGVDRLR